MAANNEEILSHVEALGGGYVWEPEIFAVTLMKVPVTDTQVAGLQDLRGVQQIALNASNLSFAAVEAIARIPALASLVLSGSTFSTEQVAKLQLICPEVLLVAAAA
ncbi:hypothetical protein [Rhodanobacter sp. C01]|uniref:hypothetical protein n=1 Tax=Rhodanobacter sp. C01 TaxID=1945856 RepID=UPI000985ECB0|nr:hypothetical protein [Rhodanobacter sp. C01]OOG45949.1 hypothetical protein B0E50_17570 [Rhodanobacter sp. C01]OOG45950.1 hypothetical protein B0E50_17575 [Rhodanobacter sp. C01]